MSPEKIAFGKVRTTRWVIELSISNGFSARWHWNLAERDHKCFWLALDETKASGGKKLAGAGGEGLTVLDNSQNHEYQDFEVLGKVNKGCRIAESIKNVCPIFLEFLKPYESPRNEASDHLSWKTIFPQVTHKSSDETSQQSSLVSHRRRYQLARLEESGRRDSLHRLETLNKKLEVNT